jgi:hypothetical protein
MSEEDEDLAALKRARERAARACEAGAKHLKPYLDLVDDCIARQEALAARAKGG